MKKITSFLMMFMLFVGMGWAQSPLTGIGEITLSDLSKLDQAKFFTLKSVSAGKYVSAKISVAGEPAKNGNLTIGNRLRLVQDADAYTKWYFVAATAPEGVVVPEDVKAVNIYNAATNQVICTHENNPWGTEAKVYYLMFRSKLDASSANTDFVIAESVDGGDRAWNNYNGWNAELGNWNATDGGSKWNVAAAELTAEDIKTLYNDRKATNAAKVASANSNVFVTYEKSALQDCEKLYNEAAPTTFSGLNSAYAAEDKAYNALNASDKVLKNLNGVTFSAKSKAKQHYISVAEGSKMVENQNKSISTCWKFVNTGAQNEYYLFNEYTKKYAKGLTNRNQATALTDVDAERGKYTVVLVPNATPLVNFVCANPEAANQDTPQGPDNCLHNAGDHGSICRWNAVADNSKWELTEVTSEELAALKEVCKTNLTNAVANIEALTANPAVGYYHVADQAAVDAAKEMVQNTANHSGYELDQTAANLKNALAVNMPVAGKAYYIGSVNKDGHTYYLSNQFNNVNVVVKDNTTEGALKFICKEVNGEYVFVTEDGKYFVWATDSDEAKMNLTGKKNGIYADAYTAGHDWTLVPGVQVQNKNEKLGTFGLKAKPKEGNAKYLMMQPDGDFHNTKNEGVDASDDANGNCIYWKLEEATYANQPEMKAVAGDMVKIDGAAKVATFSAPFATVAPAGVTAFYVANVKGNVAQLKAVEAGKAIPAGQGVVLASGADVANAVMVPAAAEEAAVVDGNLLVGTPGAAKTLAAKEAYILSTLNNVVGLYLNNAGELPMNKAYLPKSATVAAQGLRLVFGDEVTGIEGVEAVETENAPIYDLSGRRVMSTVKGGIYIQNGKKFIVK